MQADVVDDLVPRAAEERGVDRDHRPQAAHGHARGGGDRVLLGDADVEAAVGEALGERQQPGGAGHPRGDGDDLGMPLGQIDQRVANAPVYDDRRTRVRHAGLGIERADVVEPLLVVGLGREVALALAREHVHDDRTVALGAASRSAGSSAAMSWPSIGPRYVETERA